MSEYTITLSWHDYHGEFGEPGVEADIEGWLEAKGLVCRGVYMDPETMDAIITVAPKGE